MSNLIYKCPDEIFEDFLMKSEKHIFFGLQVNLLAGVEEACSSNRREENEIEYNTWFYFSLSIKAMRDEDFFCCLN